MRSPAERALLFERSMRAAALALAAFALWRLLSGAEPGGASRVQASALARELPALEAVHTSAIHVALDKLPDPSERDALAAVSHAGTRVTWTGAGLPPLVAVAERAREPGAPVRVAIASTADVALSDGLAPLDTVRAASATHGASVSVGAPSGAISARSGGTRAPVGVPIEQPLHAVLVLGRAGWEAKFAVAALEEHGWTVEQRVVVAPGADVTQGKSGAVDTSRYSAIVALDTTLGVAGASIVRFVRDGGGLVLLADAANAPAVRAIAPARVGVRRLAAERAFDVAYPVNAMPLYPLESLRADAVRLGTRGSSATTAARREGAGRVVQAGFEETWRWRMQGGADAVAAHRAWWSRMVSSVAATPLGPFDDREASPSAEAAPLARWIGALGTATADVPAPSAPRQLPVWLLPALMLCLLAEWSSRRWRGAR